MNKAIGSALALLVCGLVTAAGSFAVGAPEAKSSNPDPARFKNEIAAFRAWDRKNAFPRDGVLFVGSSSIRLWPTAESFPDLPVINRGFGGSHISDVNHFADKIVIPYAPRLIVFYAGDNDVADGKSPQQVFNDFRAFARRVHEQLPATTIVFLPIKPSVLRWKKWPQMQAVNARVKELSRNDERLVYVDTASPMLNAHGRPRAELFRKDGLHLNAKGYAIWNETLAPVLSRLVETDRDKTAHE
jgi:lysophospholipase L1-like esterase